MKNMEELDNLMDNFDIHTFWQKKKLAQILAIYGVYLLAGSVVMIRAVINASDAGAVPKGMTFKDPGSSTVVR